MAVREKGPDPYIDHFIHPHNWWQRSSECSQDKQLPESGFVPVTSSEHLCVVSIVNLLLFLLRVCFSFVTALLFRVCVLCRHLKFLAERHYPCGCRQVIGIQELVKVRYLIAV